MKQIFLISVIFIVSSFILIKPGSEFNIPVAKDIATSKPTAEDIVQYILQQDHPHSHIIAAQAVLESGNFSSKLFTKYNNMFGMKHPKKRPTLSIKSTQTQYATYVSWIDCVQDYLLWSNQHNPENLTEQQYLQILGKVYAEDPQYITKINILKGSFLK